MSSMDLCGGRPARPRRASAPTVIKGLDSDDDESQEEAAFEAKASDDESEESDESEEEDEESDHSVAEDEDEAPAKKRPAKKSPAKAPAKKSKKDAEPPAPLTDEEKGTVAKPTEGLAPPMLGAFSGEYAYALGQVCAVKCQATNRWVRGHVIMHHRGGVTSLYSVEKVRVLFEKAQNEHKAHYQDAPVTSEDEADRHLARLDLPTREVRKWTSGTPCMRATDLGHAAASTGGELDKARGFGASKALAVSSEPARYAGRGDAGARLQKAERRAASCLAAKKHGEADVLACLEELGDAWPTQDRPNVTPDGKPVRGMCLGAVFVLGGVGMAVSNVADSHPALTKLVTAWIRASLPESFPFSSIQINYNYMARKHVDGNNIGPSYIRAIGDHAGGQLWTADKFLVEQDENTGETVVKGGGGEAVLDCKNSWQLFNGNAEHYTKPYKGTKAGDAGTRISFIVFSHQAYNKLSTRVATRLRALGFTAASDDGVDLEYFAKYRIDKKEFGADENVKYFRYQRQRAIDLPPPSSSNAVTIECYGLTMARGGGWMAHCDAKGEATVHELTPNMTGFHVLELAVDAKGGPRLVSKHVDRNRFNVYQKTDAETARFCAFVKKLKPNSVARPERKKRLAF